MKLALMLLPVALVAALAWWCLLAMQKERRAIVAQLHADHERRMSELLQDHGRAIRNLYALVGQRAPAKYFEPPYIEAKELT